MPLAKALLWQMDWITAFPIFHQTLGLASVTVFIRSGEVGGRAVPILIAYAALLHCLGLFMRPRLKRETWFVAHRIVRSVGRALLFVLGFVSFFRVWTEEV